MGNHQFNHDSRSGFISRIRFHLGMLGCREIQFVMDGLVDAYFSHLNHQPQLNNNNDLKVDEGKKVSELPDCMADNFFSCRPRVSTVPSSSGHVIVTES